MSKARKPLRKHLQSSESLLKGKSSLRAPLSPQCICFSFKHLDVNQGQSLQDWSREGLLLDLLDTLHSYSTMTVDEARRNKFRIYGVFPRPSDFTHPVHVPPDAIWSSIHIKGKPCIAGHIDYERAIFYLVFLDKDHCFYPVEKK